MLSDTHSSALRRPLLSTHVEECDVVADEVTDDAGFLRRLSSSLEQAGGEDGGQFFARHVVEVGTLLNPE